MRDKGKVVHISTVHHPMDPRIMFKECQSLAQNGFDVSLLVRETDNVPTEFHGVKLIFLKKYKNRFVSMLLSPIEAYRKAKQLEADYYHFHDPELLPVGRLLKKKNNTVVYDVHEDYESGIVTRDYFIKSVRIMFSKVYKLVEKMTISPMKVVLAEKYYKEKYPMGTCILNYPKVSEASIVNVDRDFSSKRHLLYTGNVTEDRGAMLHALLPAIDEDIHVHLIGKCSSDLYRAMKSLAGDYSERLSVTGIDQFITKDIIDQTYEENRWLAGIAIFPDSEHYRRKELTKFFEYMLAGMPIICSDFPKWKEFIEKYQCGIVVDPNSKEEIKAAIMYLKENPLKAKEMGEKGRKAVLNELNWEAEAEKLKELYINERK
ncbi:glycosyltransferase [Salipaludibacillus daqingensis]|uniref:glycosyltransferase n=1 Tax=Salipaludibacillus daqingensis TaxID=3041001 RepID=UPI0024754E39|nr:glycosyltransferase [Salipaludibacillus daqingensis]